MVSTGQLPPGHRLQSSHYTIKDLVGQGSYGFVYSASDNFQGGFIVAIKELKQGTFSPEDLLKERQLFQKEADILQQLSPHPHIPRYYDRFSEQGRDYIVMEFIDGDTLQTKIDKSPTQQIPVEQALNYGIQICSTLSHLHQQSPPIILRDLKPANVKVTANEQVYLLDFGIARKYKPEKIDDTTIRFTRQYAAPEAFCGRTEPRSDLYSLGAVLYHCLTGRVPNNNSPLPFNGQPDVVRPVHDFNSEVSPRLDSLIQQLVAFLKIYRPANAATVLKELDAIRNGAAATTQPLSFNPTPQLRLFFSRLTAHAIQLLVFSSRGHTLLSLADVYRAKLLIFCSALGSWIELRLLSRVASCWQKLRLSIGKIRQRILLRRNYAPTQPAFAPPQSVNHVVAVSQQFWQGNKLVRVVLDSSGTIAREMKGTVDPQTGVSPNLVPFAGVFAIIVCCAIGMLAVLHLSPYVALFILTAILLLLSFSASVQQKIDEQVEQVQNIFKAVMIAALLACIALAELPDVKHMLASISINVLLCCLIGAFILTSLFRSTGRNIWIDHFAIIAIAIACAGQQYLLGTQEVQTLTPSLASVAFVATLQSIIIGALCIIVCMALFRVNEPYGKKRFSFSVILIACIAIPLQFAFYKQDMPAPVQHMVHTSITTIALLFAGIFVVSIIAANTFFTKAGQEMKRQALAGQQNGQTRRVSRVPWERLGRIPLVFVIIPCLLLQYSVGTMHSQQTPDGITLFLKLRPLDPVHVNQSIVSLLLLLVVMLLLSWLRRCASLIINTLASVGIGIICLLLPATVWGGNATSVPLYPSMYILSALAWIIAITLLSLVISVWLQLSHPRFQFSWLPGLVIRLEQIIRIFGYLILTLCALLCVFFALAYGDQLPNILPPVQDPPLTQGQFAAVIMAIPVTIAFILLIISCCQLLRRLPDRGSKQANAIPPYDRQPKITWHGTGIFFDGLLLTMLLISLLLITWNVGNVEKVGIWQHYTYPALPAILTQVYTLLPLPLWLAEFGLLLIVGVSFFKLQPDFEHVKRATIRLLLVLALICKTLATVCIILLSLGLWAVLVALPFPMLEIVCLTLLILTVLLIAWAENERLAGKLKA